MCFAGGIVLGKSSSASLSTVLIQRVRECPAYDQRSRTTFVSYCQDSNQRPHPPPFRSSVPASGISPMSPLPVNGTRIKTLQRDFHEIISTENSDKFALVTFRVQPVAVRGATVHTMQARASACTGTHLNVFMKYRYAPNGTATIHLGTAEFVVRKDDIRVKTAVELVTNRTPLCSERYKRDPKLRSQIVFLKIAN